LSIDRKDVATGSEDFWFLASFREGAGLKNPVTELKLSQYPKRPLIESFLTSWLQYFEHALDLHILPHFWN
jgi:hypothetical protein